MNADVFLDSNVLVYAAMVRADEEFKRQRALALIESEHFGKSAQVLQEFYITVVRKAKRPLTSVEALEWIHQWAAFPCQPIDRQFVQIAVEIPNATKSVTGMQPSSRPRRRLVPASSTPKT